MRVIGGSARSIRLAGPSSEGTRPLSDRARESLFNILGQSVVDAFLVDLFAGTGAVGVEALSRGAARVTFVERDRVALDDISENIRRVHGESQALIERGDVFSYLRRPVSPPADIVFSGPPQWDDLWSTTLEAIDAAPDFLAEDGVVVTQLDPREDGADPPLEHLRRADERTYGRIRLLFHRPVASPS
jgi:16S rRNA (guanine966-N2)-methyltransferase